MTWKISDYSDFYNAHYLFRYLDVIMYIATQYYNLKKMWNRSILDILFSSNRNIHKSSCGLCFCASDLLIDRFYLNLSIKGLKPKNKGHTNFYECCDLTKKVYLPKVCTAVHFQFNFSNVIQTTGHLNIIIYF